MTTHDRLQPDWVAAHGLLILLAFAPLRLLPDFAARWPVPLLLPLSIYGLVVGLTPPLRRSCTWIQLGHCRGPVLGMTAFISVVSCGALILYQSFRSPSLEHLESYLPMRLLGDIYATAIVFSLINPILEEAIFRGVLFKAFEVRWNWKVAVLASSVAFGVGHVGGYPPGIAGAVLAGCFGVALGVLTHYSRGLFAPFLAHVCADATICGIRIGTG